MTTTDTETLRGLQAIIDDADNDRAQDVSDAAATGERIDLWTLAETAWQPIETAPRDADILVWFDHDADPYQDQNDTSRLTDYAAWAEAGDFMSGRGFCIAKWFPPHWEATDEYGSGYWLPAAWFCLENDDYERVVNPTHWMPLPAPPTDAARTQEGE